MNRRQIRFGSVVAALAFLFAANAHAQPSRKTDAGQFARGAKAWAAQCGRCHNLRDPKEFGDQDWSTIVIHMRVRANLPGRMARDIAAFLRASN